MNEDLAADANADHRFSYQLLARLKQDCDYYLGFGNRAKKHLWAGDEAAQIAKMKDLHSAIPEKPEWLSLDDIGRYEAEMVDDSRRDQLLDGSGKGDLENGEDRRVNE